MFPGGIADKLGNRYEAKWLVRQFLDVIGGKAQWLCYEGISGSFRGFEFAVSKNGTVEWHQTKRGNPNGNWTLSALQREGVLTAFKRRFEANEKDLCCFVSQDSAKELVLLTGKAKVASTFTEYQEALGGNQTEKFKEVLDIWKVTPEIGFFWLRRSDFRTESEPSIDSAISTYADFYFSKASDASFEILREFLEKRFNSQITTEDARRDLRSEGRLALKDWSLDLTLRERLSIETKAYLESYSPFGLGGSRISRAETRSLVTWAQDPAGSSVVLLTGAAGTGKSGVIREFVEKLDDLGVTHLAIRIDHYLNCTSPKALGKAVTDRDESPITTLKGLAPDQLSILIVDQVDAVSEVSGRNGAVKQAILRLVDDVRNFGSTRLVIACRTFDLEADQRLKALKESRGIDHVNVALLTWSNDVEPLLQSKSINVRDLSVSQRGLLCLPLNLAIFLEVQDGTQQVFASRNDLFTRLLEKKARTVRFEREISWELFAPLSRLAEWMSEQQRLDAPEDILASFGGATDILTSEGLIARSRGSVNFFHESFFDYIYARGFAARQISLVSFLGSAEQHLFRRTQVRQILETLRQADKPRYLRELRAVMNCQDIRYHIKVAVALWLGSISDPTAEEKSIILGLDTTGGPFPPLVRYALLGSPGWFDMLLQDGWITSNLSETNPGRMDSVFFWLAGIAGRRPAEIAGFLDGWWGGSRERGVRLLNWFGFVKRQDPDAALVELFCRVIRSNPLSLFEGEQSNKRNLVLHTWVSGNAPGADEVLKAYFDSWFSGHPNQHPFEREFHDLDAHYFKEMTQLAPEAFVDGSIAALTRAVELILQKESEGDRDSAFKHRAYSGHHLRADAFLSMFRDAIQAIAKRDPNHAKRLLAKLNPNRHEVYTHLWLETIRVNAGPLSGAFIEVLESPYVFEAGWDGADWKSFADAAKEAIPHLGASEVASVEARIFSDEPELKFAAKIAGKLKAEGEVKHWLTRERVIECLNRSGHAQWCILETIGEQFLTVAGRRRLATLRRKFPKLRVPEPHHSGGYFIRSPIKHEGAVHMSDGQWLRAMERYDNDTFRRPGWAVGEGGAEQLATELQRLAKEQPIRFATLLLKIPDRAHPTYIRHIIWGLSEASDLNEEVLRAAVLNIHARPDRPYGNEIARLFGKYPQLAADDVQLNILLWYVEYGEADGDDTIVSSANQRELITIEDVINAADSVHVRGLNTARGAAADALGNVLWQIPQVIGRVWPFIERRAIKEHLVSVRCSLMSPTVPLYNDNRERCATLADSLSRPPGDTSTLLAAALAKVWIALAFPTERLPDSVKKGSVWGAKTVERLARRYAAQFSKPERAKWWSPLLTHSGVHLLPFLLHSTPAIGKALIFRLVVCGDESSRLIGAWQACRQSFQTVRYAPLADAFSNDGVIYRRFFANIASHAITRDEYRYRAEDVLERSFENEDRQVRYQAASVFRNIKPDEFAQYRGLAAKFLKSRAFESESWEFFNALGEAECRVDDLVVSATERLLAHIKHAGNSGGSRSLDLHELQEIIKKEYASSELDPELRRRLLDLIDDMLALELYGVEEIIKAHER